MRTWLLLCSIILICIGATLMLYSFFVIDHVERQELSIIAGNEGSAFFGNVTPPGIASKNISIATREDRYVSIKATGSISEFIRVSENDFFLPAGQSKTISLTVDLPYDARGRYEGTLVMYFKRFNL
ncbi:MAG: hypothetical protein V1725_02005 [archaeon]